MRNISSCDAGIQLALEMLQVCIPLWLIIIDIFCYHLQSSVPIRILKQTQESERNRHVENEALLAANRSWWGQFVVVVFAVLVVFVLRCSFISQFSLTRLFSLTQTLQRTISLDLIFFQSIPIHFLVTTFLPSATHTQSAKVPVCTASQLYPQYSTAGISLIRYEFVRRFCWGYSGPWETRI